jgi:hypothetical protein
MKTSASHLLPQLFYKMFSVFIIALVFVAVFPFASSRVVSHRVGRSNILQTRIIQKYERHGYTFLNIERLSKKRYILHFNTDMETDEKATANGRISLEHFMECSHDNAEVCIQRNQQDLEGVHSIVIIMLLIMATIIIMPMATSAMQQY